MLTELTDLEQILLEAIDDAKDKKDRLSLSIEDRASYSKVEADLLRTLTKLILFRT